MGLPMGSAFTSGQSHRACCARHQNAAPSSTTQQRGSVLVGVGMHAGIRNSHIAAHGMCMGGFSWARACICGMRMGVGMGSNAAGMGGRGMY